jgi:hypothetical protein
MDASGRPQDSPNGFDTSKDYKAILEFMLILPIK